jgi:Cu2+-exporting ATPase
MSIPTRNTEPRIVHETKTRLRLRGRIFKEPRLDVEYLQAYLEAMPGVESVRINQAAGSVAVRYDGASPCRASIIATLRDIPSESYKAEESFEGIIGAEDVMLSALRIFLVSRYLPMEIRTVVAWLAAAPTVIKGVTVLTERGVKVELLDASAVLFSLLRQDYFTSTSILFLLKLAGYLEQNTENKSNQLLKSLLRPQVDEVWLEKDGKEQRASLSEVRIGDVLICGSGELVPIDGVVASGQASVNQSSITGESVPVHLKPGDEALSGSVVEEGRLHIRADRVGTETTTARISRFLEQSLRMASKTQSRSAELADKLVPVTFGLGLGILGLTRDLRKASAVLTVDFSCSLKLATPVAVKSGMHAAAHSGVLIKGGSAMESLAEVDTFVFDKTGTLTTGTLSVTDIVPMNGMDENELLAKTAAAEEHYGHPVARAVVVEAKARELALPETLQVDFIVAHGVSAYIDGSQVLVGSRHFIHEDESIDCDPAEAQAKDLRSQGKTILYVAEKDRLIGIIALRDEKRPEAEDVLKRLKDSGIKQVIVLTGDHKDTAKALAEELPIDDIRWELKPQEKAKIVDELRSEGRKVAFLGDGVNDAPALMSADLGIAVRGGADLARESAQAVLLTEDIACLADAYSGSKRIMSTVKNCFYLTIGLNSLILLPAVLGKNSPLRSALLHNASTVGILLYALASASSAFKTKHKQKELS